MRPLRCVTKGPDGICPGATNAPGHVARKRRPAARTSTPAPEKSQRVGYDTRVLIHDRYGFVLTVVAALGAVAAMLSLLRPRILPLVRLYLRITIAVIAIQVVIGLVLVASGERPHQLLHWLYGAATLATLPIAIAIGKRLGGRDEQIWLAGGAVLTVLFAVRALATG